MRTLLRRFRTDRGGATAIEYGLIAALVSIVVIGALIALDERLLKHWWVIADYVQSAS